MGFFNILTLALTAALAAITFVALKLKIETNRLRGRVDVQSMIVGVLFGVTMKGKAKLADDVVDMCKQFEENLPRIEEKQYRSAFFRELNKAVEIRNELEIVDYE